MKTRHDPLPCGMCYWKILTDQDSGFKSGGRNQPVVFESLPAKARRTGSEGNPTTGTSPDELMAVLKRYLRESNESESVVASRIGVNHHTLSRWLNTSQSPTGGRLALTACFLRRVEYL
jgi:hypothetical protein